MGGSKKPKRGDYVITLLKLGEEQEALGLFQRLFREHPYWAENPALLQLRGRMYYQLAKRCSHTAGSRDLSPRLKAKAWDECRRYLEEAGRDFRAALEHVPDPVLADYVKGGLEAVEALRKKVKRPGRPRK